jgi:hypothetical protein
LRSPHTTHHTPLTTHHSPLTTHHTPLTTHHSPSPHTTHPHHTPHTTHHTTHQHMGRGRERGEREGEEGEEGGREGEEGGERGRGGEGGEGERGRGEGRERNLFVGQHRSSIHSCHHVIYQFGGRGGERRKKEKREREGEEKEGKEGERERETYLWGSNANTRSSIHSCHHVIYQFCKPFGSCFFWAELSCCVSQYCIAHLYYFTIKLNQD